MWPRAPIAPRGALSGIRGAQVRGRCEQMARLMRAAGRQHVARGALATVMAAQLPMARERAGRPHARWRAFAAFGL